jgi:putative ABC transport system ATP-binding protein
LDKPTSGKVYIDGEELTNQTEKELTRLRRKKIGFIFQFYNLIPVLTAFENVELPMIIAGLSRNEAAKRAQALLESTKLLDRAAHRPDELSGGEQQRIAIARALANRPSIILADEPTGDLDSATGKLVMRMLFEMSRQEKATVIVATHDPAVVDMADRLLRMKDGQVITDEKMSLQKGA